MREEREGETGNGYRGRREASERDPRGEDEGRWEEGVKRERGRGKGKSRDGGRIP